MKETDLQFGADTFVHLQKLTIPSHPQGLQGLLSPWEPVQDPHTMRRRLLKFPLCHLCAAEVWWRQCKLERFQCAWLGTKMLFLFGCSQWQHQKWRCEIRPHFQTFVWNQQTLTFLHHLSLCLVQWSSHWEEVRGEQNHTKDVWVTSAGLARKKEQKLHDNFSTYLMFFIIAGHNLKALHTLARRRDRGKRKRRRMRSWVWQILPIKPKSLKIFIDKSSEKESLHGSLALGGSLERFCTVRPIHFIKW